MAAHVVVIDTAFRREKVKVGPTTYMADVLDEVCGKWNLPASNYILKYVVPHFAVSSST